MNKANILLFCLVVLCNINNILAVENLEEKKIDDFQNIYIDKYVKESKITHFLQNKYSKIKLLITDNYLLDLIDNSIVLTESIDNKSISYDSLQDDAVSDDYVLGNSDINELSNDRETVKEENIVNESLEDRINIEKASENIKKLIENDKKEKNHSKNIKANNNDCGCSIIADLVDELSKTVVSIYTKKIDYNNTQKGDIYPYNESKSHIKEIINRFNLFFTIENEQKIDQNSFSLGSGFIIDAEQGLIISNYHVVSDAKEIFVKLHDDTTLTAKLIGSDPKTDLVILKINCDKKLSQVAFEDIENLCVGENVIAISNYMGFHNSVTRGIISAKNRDLDNNNELLINDFIQTDVAINLGSSGSPLFNMNGKVIGINNYVHNTEDKNISFAISINEVKNVIADLIKYGEVDRGRLDIAIQDLTPKLSNALDISDNIGGVLVANVKKNGIGEKAGIEIGDVVIEFDGFKILNSQKLQLLIAKVQNNDPVTIKVIRNGKIVNLTARILDHKNKKVNKDLNSEISKINKDEILKSTYSGITVSTISDKLREKFAIDKNIEAIIVLEIEDDENVNSNNSLAIGDIILAINKQYVKNITDFASVYSDLQKEGKNNVALLIIRNEVEMFATLNIEQKDK